MTLRVTVDLHDGLECRVSLAARLAYANGYPSLRDFLAVNGIGIKALETGQPAAVAMLADWAGTDPERLKGNNIRSRGVGDIWQLGKASMSRDMRPGLTHRYCPRCVADDLSEGTGRIAARPFVRVSWRTRAVRCCPYHRTEIVEVPDNDGDRDFPRYVEANLERIEHEAAVEEVATTGLELYVEHRISGVSHCEYLDNLEAYVAVDLCRYLGTFANQHSPVDDDGQSSWHRDAGRGYAIASEGVAAIEAVVAEAARHKRPPALEMNAFFGKLRRWMLRNQEKREFEPVIELFQDIAERHLPIGKDDLFVLPTRQRRLHSVRSASIEYGMMEDRVYQLVVDAGLTAPSNETSGRIYFDAQKGHDVIGAALETLTSAQLAEALDVSIDRARAILDAGLIPRVEEATDNSRVYSRVRRADFEAFKSTIARQATPLREAGHRVLLADAARKTICSCEKILALILEGKLPSLSRISDGFISGLVVDPNELALQIHQQRRSRAERQRLAFYDAVDTGASLVNARQAERRLQTASGTARELIRLGFLKTVFALNPMTQRSQHYVTVASVDAFAAANISLTDLAGLKNVSTSALRKQLDVEDIKPTFEPVGNTSRFYPRDSVAHLVQ